MTQILLFQHCPQCGTRAIAKQHFCPKCGTNRDTTLYQDNVSLDDDATIRVSAVDTDATIRVTTADRDATHLAASRLSSKLYLRAVEQSHTAHDLYADQTTQPKLPVKNLTFHAAGEKPKVFSKKKLLIQVGCIVGLVLLLGLLFLALRHPSNTASIQQKQVAQNKLQLDRAIRYAQSIGVTASFLQPVSKQEQLLNTSHPPVAFFDTHATAQYYQDLAQRYHMLQVQLSDITIAATTQAQTQAEQNMQSFETTIAQQNSQGTDVMRYFLQQFSQDQLLLSSAKYPKEYQAISQNAVAVLHALSAMQITRSQLVAFRDTIDRMKAAQLDVTAMQTQYQNDMQLFNQATTASDFQNLNAQIDVQYQQVVVSSIQAFPYVSVTKLNQLQDQIHQLTMYGIDASKYQAHLNKDQVTVSQARTVYDNLLFFKEIDADITSMYHDLVQGKARYLVKQFHREVDAWAKAHPYHDPFNGRDYALDNGYMQGGIGATLDGDLTSADTDASAEAVITEANNDLFNLHMLELDYTDKTAYNQVHAADMQMLQHYNLQGKQVVMVSLVEQVMRVYQQGKLVRSYYVTTGRQERPSPPGVWTVLERKAPIIFTSADPKGSPYWFPDTPINYAILYRWGGDFVHDAPWRASFGPGTQFPHADAGGNTAYNFDGSHGCVNLSERDAAWVYNNTNWNTVIVVY